MASGDAQRAWFPEMTSKLSNKWDEGMSWKQCSVFCATMTKLTKGNPPALLG